MSALDCSRRALSDDAWETLTTFPEILAGERLAAFRDDFGTVMPWQRSIDEVLDTVYSEGP